MTKPTILIDIDGVLADWQTAAILAHGLNPAGVCQRWDYISLREPRPWSLSTVLSISDDEMWAPIYSAGHDWWVALKTFQWTMDLYETCCDIGPTYLLTSPSRDPSSHSGKAAWITKHFGKHMRDYLIGAPKHLCARPGSLLIDDRPKNCEDFIAAGGHAIMFPTIGNLLHHKRTQPLEHVAAKLDEWLAGNKP